MAKLISTALVAEKNKVASVSAWLLLVEVNFPSAETIYITDNTEDFDWNGQTWQALPFKLDPIREDGKGALPTFALRITNVGRLLTSVIEQYDGCTGATVTLRVINSAHPEELEPVFEEVGSISGVTVDKDWASFTVGAENPLLQRSPRQRYLMNHCRYKEFKGELCGYTGDAGNCDRTMSTCDSLGNLTRFGGFPGIGVGQGVYLT